MQAAHDACRIPLLIRHILNRAISPHQGRIEKDEQVEPANKNNPEEKKC